jgi:putative FmdB family regulatory protein
MPIYEFTCDDCKRLTSVFQRSMTAKLDCGSKKLSRAPSKFAYHGSSARFDSGSEPRSLEDYKDPRQIGRWAERKFDEYGMDMPKEARDMIDAARDGEMPSPVDDL